MTTLHFTGSFSAIDRVLLVLASSSIGLLYSPYSIPFLRGLALVAPLLPTNLLAHSAFFTYVQVFSVQLESRLVSALLRTEMNTFPDFWAILDSPIRSNNNPFTNISKREQLSFLCWCCLYPWLPLLSGDWNLDRRVYIISVTSSQKVRYSVFFFAFTCGAISPLHWICWSREYRVVCRRNLERSSSE